MFERITNASRQVHNRYFSGSDESLCSRAFWAQWRSPSWRAFRVVVDFVFWPVERDHCRKSFDRYH